jgi:ketosteroid isomerase-like protein
MGSQTHETAIEIINHAHHRRDPDALLDLIADDAELVSYDMDRLGEPTRLSGKVAIEEMMRDVFSRDMVHEVREVVIGGDRISYMVHCRYPDGTRVVSSTFCELRDGKIVRIVGQQAWSL